MRFGVKGSRLREGLSGQAHVHKYVHTEKESDTDKRRQKDRQTDVRQTYVHTDHRHMCIHAYIHAFCLVAYLRTTGVCLRDLPKVVQKGFGKGALNLKL